MKARIVEYLRLKAATIGGVNTHLGIHELRTNGNGQTVPYAYVGGDDLQPLDIDNGSVGYFRTYQREEFTPVDGMRAERDLSGTFYIRYAAILHRDTRDHVAYAEDVANAFTGFNSDLKSILKAKRVNITRSSIETDITRAWREEFSVPVTDLPYNLAMVFVDVTVTVVGSRDCWQGCSEQYDILQGFDWCNPATVSRLTEAQRDCIRGFLPAPCDDATVELNGVEMATIPSGDTENIEVRQSTGSTLVGSQQGQYWRIGDSEISINGTPVEDVQAEDLLDIPVIQDGSPVGSWNGTQWVIPSCPTSASISVAVSDTNPDVGDTITITSTPTSFTPTEYIYLLFDGVNVTLLAQQAGNIFNWSITQPTGTYDIYVLATDGTTNVFDSIEVVINSAYYLDKWPDNVLSAVSMQRLSSTYAGDMLRARVSASEQNIGFDGDLRDNTALATFAGSSNAFMPRWDNQTGLAAGNFTQTTAANQPRVAAAGIPEQSGGFDSCLFSNSRMVSTAMDALTVSDQPFTYHLVAEWRTTANVLQSAFISEPTGANSYHTLWRLTSNGNIQWTKRINTNANQKRLEALLPINQRVLVTIDYDSSTGTGRLYVNGQLLDSGDMSGVYNTPLPSPTFGAFANGAQPFEGEWIESIFHGASQFAAGDIVAQMNNIIIRHGI
jgi:hypothetical protein